MRPVFGRISVQVVNSQHLAYDVRNHAQLGFVSRYGLTDGLVSGYFEILFRAATGEAVLQCPSTHACRMRVLAGVLVSPAK